MDDAWIERANQWAELIHRENHFNFIKMHYLNHYVQDVRRFGCIPMYSTDISEPAHEEQIKEGYRRSNKSDSTGQILAQYTRQHSIGMRLLTMEVLEKMDNAFEIGNISVSGQGRRVEVCPTQRIPERALKGHTQNVGMLLEICRLLEISYDNLAAELVSCIRQAVPDKW